MKKNLISSIFVSALALLFPMQTLAYDFMVDGLCYNINSDGTSVTVTYQTASTPRYSDLTGNLNIPDNVTNEGVTYSVTSIGEYAFGWCTGLTGNLVIPNSVTSIGNNAFYGCSGFNGSLTISNSISSISNYVFGQCKGLTGELVIPNSVTSIGDYAFQSCSRLTGELVIPNSVTSIGGYAFSDCSGFTGELVIPNSVTSIGAGAFSCCSGFTGSLIIPNSVTSIGSSAFQSCIGFNGNLVVPNSVTSIGNSTFKGCSGLTGELVLPNGLISIWHSAFQNCSGFTGSLTIPNSVTNIYVEAFSGCSGFNGTLIIPNSVNWIGQKAFYGCSGLTGELALPNSIDKIQKETFYGCCGFTGDLIIPSSVTSIEDNSFSNCSGFTSVTIGSSITSFGSSVFSGCTGLNSVTWNVKNCSDFTAATRPFPELTNITDFSFGDEVVKIPAQLCYGLTGLSHSLIIPNSVTSIGSQACYGCNSLPSVLIGSSVASIGYSAFNGCSGLNSIYSQIENPSSVTLGTKVFTGVDKNTCVLHVPEGKVQVYKAAAQWKDFLNIAEITDATWYELASNNAITTTAHQATPIIFSFKNFAAVKGIEFDVETSTWLNATGTVSVKTGTAEPRSVDFVSQPVFTLTDRFIGEMDEEKWMYLFGQTDLIEHDNMLNGTETEKGLVGTVAIHMGEEVQTEEGIVVKEYLEAGEGELFAINLYPLISGDHSINISNVKITLVDGSEVELDPFTINVKANRIPGDLNDDGVVDENDVPGGGKKCYNLTIDAGNMVSGTINTETLMPISMHNTGNITAFSLTINLPERIVMVDDINSFISVGERGENFTFTATQNQDGTITINGTSSEPLAAGDGAVLNLKVKTAWQNTYTIPVTNMTVTTADGTVKQLPDSETRLVMQGVRGDMNGDGRVDLSDALYIINLATGQAE